MSALTISAIGRAGTNWAYPVRLDGKLVGNIRMTKNAALGRPQYQYKPTGARGGEFFPTLETCVASLRS